MFAALGAGLWHSAFILAFTLPNLFRRLFGEGALTSAFIPVFSDLLKQNDRASAFKFLNRLLWQVFMILAVVVLVIACLLKLLAWSGWLPERWSLSADLSVWLLPYMIFVCLAALMTAALNALGRFWVAASTPILLNLSIILSLGLGMYFFESPAGIIYSLILGVLFGGLLQFLMPFFDLKRTGWRPYLEKENSLEIYELWKLFLPGVAGAAVLQINVLLSRLLAFTLNDGATAVLYMSSRLMELPLGVFTFAVVAVYFPRMAQSRALEDRSRFKKDFITGLVLVCTIALPAAVGLCVLAKPILITLFQRGAFTEADVLRTIPLVVVYSIGLPFYSVATFASRTFHADKSMKTPVRIAGVCLAVNLLFSLGLMRWIGEVGLASANVLAAIVQATLLLKILKKNHLNFSFSEFKNPLLKIFFASAVMGTACYFGLGFFQGFESGNQTTSLPPVLCLVPTGALLYLALLYILRLEVLVELTHTLRDKKENEV
jgi:putative peptidoglycan lipid II flippase